MSWGPQRVCTMMSPMWAGPKACHRCSLNLCQVLILGTQGPHAAGLSTGQGVPAGGRLRPRNSVRRAEAPSFYLSERQRLLGHVQIGFLPGHQTVGTFCSPDSCWAKATSKADHLPDGAVTANQWRLLPVCPALGGQCQRARLFSASSPCLRLRHNAEAASRQPRGAHGLEPGQSRWPLAQTPTSPQPWVHGAP